jgi:hypothetical protein
MARYFIVSFFTIVFALFSCPSSADSDNVPKNSIHIFFGQYTTVCMGDSLEVFKASNYEKNYPLALAYARNFRDLGYGLRMGGEFGLADRLGATLSTEIWSGVVIRHKGFTSHEGLNVALSLTVGLSLISKSVGEEIKREVGREGNATFLFYLGPELVFSYPGLRRWEFVYRLHHRSGAGGTLGGLYEGYNANTLGIRYRF